MMSEEDLFKIDIGDIDSDDESNKKKPDYYVDHFLTKDDSDEGLIEEAAGNDSPLTGSSETCWKCNKIGHIARDCTSSKGVPVKKQFIKTQNSKRYHDNKFAKFRPGKCSSKLREALGLRSNEVPYHIYKMRMLGYPPGWLDDAKITNSGIKMYNSSGKRIPEPDEEEGEIVIKSMKYDVEKIIEYPGFNVSLDRTFRDESRSYGFPPMKSEHKINNFIKYLEKISTDVEESSDNNTDEENIDMDLSEMLPVDIEETSKFNDSNLKNTDKNEDCESNDNKLNEKAEMNNEQNSLNHIKISKKSEDFEENSLEEGEVIPESLNRKRNLINTNNDTNENESLQNKRRKSDEASDVKDEIINNNDNENDDKSIDEVANEKITSTIKKSDQISGESLSDSNENNISDKEIDFKTISADSVTSYSLSTDPSSIVKRSEPIDIKNQGNSHRDSSSKDDTSSSSFGTPNVKSHSPFSKLPSFKNFNKDISDVIDFENLPDSVGKYESMCTIITKIRSFMSSKLTKSSKEKQDGDR